MNALQSFHIFLFRLIDFDQTRTRDHCFKGKWCHMIKRFIYISMRMTSGQHEVMKNARFFERSEPDFSFLLVASLRNLSIGRKENWCKEQLSMISPINVLPFLSLLLPLSPILWNKKKTWLDITHAFPHLLSFDSHLGESHHLIWTHNYISDFPFYFFSIDINPVTSATIVYVSIFWRLPTAVITTESIVRSCGVWKALLTFWLNRN